MRTPKEEFTHINKTLPGQDAVAVVAHIYGYEQDGVRFGLHDDPAGLDAEKFLGGVAFPGDGSVLVKIMEALGALIVTVIGACGQQSVRAMHANYRRRNFIQRVRAVNYLHQSVPEIDRSEARRLFLNLEERLDNQDVERFERVVAEVNAPGNDLF